MPFSKKLTLASPARGRMTVITATTRRKTFTFDCPISTHPASKAVRRG